MNQYSKDRGGELLKEFVDRCERMFFAFDTMGASRFLTTNIFEKIWAKHPDARNASFGIGSELPGTHGSSGKSVSIQQGDLVEALKSDGEFDNLNRQAFLVFVYHLWDEHYRNEIAKVLGLRTKDDVRCDLLGDIRKIRNCIIHNNAILDESHLVGLQVLPKIWNLQPGDLNITGDMMMDLITKEFREITVRISQINVAHRT